MNKQYTLLLLVALLTFVSAQDNTDLNVQSSAASSSRVGEATVVSVQDELQTEAEDHAKLVYEQSNFASSYGSLAGLSENPSLQPTMQIVSGILYTFYWTTESGNIVVIKVHIVPWQQAPEQRFPIIQNQITLYQQP